jgi:hypothetical protein
MTSKAACVWGEDVIPYLPRYKPGIIVVVGLAQRLLLPVGSKARSKRAWSDPTLVNTSLWMLLEPAGALEDEVEPDGD